MKTFGNTIAFAALLFAVSASGQVGVGTTTPSATLDVTALNATGTTVDGILIPRVSRLRAQSMTGTPTSTMVYVNDISNGSATGTTINVTSTGFYFFNGAVWERLASGANDKWAVTGNSGLSGTANFLGTTDNVDLAFRRNNVASGKIGATSTGFGVNALTNGVSTNSVGIGTNALALTTGSDNVAVGNGTLAVTTTGIQNVGIGNGALATNTGNASTAVGHQALNMNTSASNGTAMGFQALMRNTSSNNTAFGFQALTNNTSGNNTAVGHQALAATTTGSGNTAVGSLALTSNTGGQNTAIGFEAARSNTTAGSNTAIGYQALFFNTNGSNITAIGRHALHNNTAGGNTAVGQQALLANTTAANNTAVGSDALRINTGSGNTAMGFMAADEHGGGANNTYIGSESGRYNTGAATHNAFLGWQSGYRTTGSYNTAIGSNTMKGTGASANNVAVGYNAMVNSTSASNNTALGYGALSSNSTGNGNVAIGYNAGANETGSDKLYIDNTNANESAALIYGDFNTNIARVNGTFQINNPANANGYAMPNVRGTAGQILQTDGAGGTSWVTNTATTLSLVKANLSANQVLTDAGWQKINFNTEAFDTSNEFNTGNGRFTATKAGFYRIDAMFHTNTQSNYNLYSIGISVNGTYQRMDSHDHQGNGNVMRSVSCLVQLAVNDYVEIFVENFVTGVEIDAYIGKTAVEIQQIR